MTQFLAKPLASLSAIYRFVGGLRGSSRIDLASPIVLVHDVAPEAEHGGSLVFNLTHSVSTLGGGVPVLTEVDVSDFFDGTISGPTAELATLGRTPENTDVYLLNAYAYVTASGAGLSRAIMGLRPPNNERYISTGGQTPRIILFGNSELVTSNSIAGGQLMIFHNGNARGSMRFLSLETFPIRVQTLFFNTIDDAVAAVTVTYGEVFGFFPINTLPRIGS